MTSDELDQESMLIRSNSSDALAAISASGREPSDADRVCWHFRSLDEVADGQSAEFYDHVEALLPKQIAQIEMERMVFGSFELWEKSFPTADWLKQRLAQFRTFGVETGTCPEGWSYEPSDRQKGWIPQAWADDNESSN